MPSNLIDDGAQAERGAVSGARPPGQARRLLLAGGHGNETVHFGKGHPRSAPRGRDVGQWPFATYCTAARSRSL